MERAQRTTRALLAASALIAALAGVSACTEGGGAIFATIEQEAPPDVSNLPDTATVANVLKLRADGATEFVAVARTMFLGLQKTAGDNSGLDWTAVSSLIETPAGSGEYSAPDAVACVQAVLTTGATAADDRMWGILAVTQAAVETVGLYVAAPESTVSTDAGVTPTLEWSPVAPSPGFGAGSPQGILLVNGEIFVTLRAGAVVPQYELYHLDVDPLTYAAAAVLVLEDMRLVSDGDYHDSAYWFVAGTGLFTGDLSGALAREDDAAIEISAGAYSGLHASGTRLFMSSDRGTLYVRAEGGTWTASAELTYSSDSAPLKLTDFVTVGTHTYVGSAERGFFELDADGLLTTATLADARRPDRTFAELYGGTILGFVPLADVVFIRTAGTGLWHQEVVDDLPTTGWTWD